MDDDLAIDSGLQQRALAHERFAQHAGIRDVAVVHQAEVALMVAHQDRLRVDEAFAASRGITHVTEGGAAGQMREHAAAEARHDQAVRLLHACAAFRVDGQDAGRLLTTVLQRVQPQVCVLRRSIEPGYAYNTAHLLSVSPVASFWPRAGAVPRAVTTRSGYSAAARFISRGIAVA